MALMDKQHMRGTNEQTGSICVALMGRPGAHAWHCRVVTEHTCDTDGQTASTRVAPPASRHMRVSAGQSPSRSRQPGRAAPSHPPRGPLWPPSPPPPRGRSSGTVFRPPPLAPQWRRSVPPRDSRGCGARSGCGGRGSGARHRGRGPAFVSRSRGRQDRGCPGAGLGAGCGSPGPAGQAAAAPVNRGRCEAIPVLAAGGGPPLFTFPPPLPLPPRLLPGSAAARQVPASAPAGLSRRTRAPAPRRPFVWDRHRDPRPPTPPTPPRPLGAPLRYPAPRPCGAVWPGSGEAGGGRGGPARGAHPTGAGAGGAAAPGPGVEVGGGRPVGGGEAALTGGIPLRGGGGRRGAEEAGTGGRAGGRREGGRGTSRSRL